jgi:Ca-activated chloride channel family protein
MREAIDDLELGEGTNIGGAIEGATDTIVGALETDENGRPMTREGKTPGAIVLLTDGETVEGGKTGPEGAVTAAEAGIPVYGIAFGTPDGVVVLTDPATGDTFEQPVPVKYEELTESADLTGGTFYTAETEGALRNAYADIEANLSPALEVPEPQQVEVTWRYVLVALALLVLALALGLWWLGGLV